MASRDALTVLRDCIVKNVLIRVDKTTETVHLGDASFPKTTRTQMRQKGSGKPYDLGALAFFWLSKDLGAGVYMKQCLMDRWMSIGNADKSEVKAYLSGQKDISVLIDDQMIIEQPGEQPAQPSAKRQRTGTGPPVLKPSVMDEDNHQYTRKNYKSKERLLTDRTSFMTGAVSVSDHKTDDKSHKFEAKDFSNCTDLLDTATKALKKFKTDAARQNQIRARVEANKTKRRTKVREKIPIIIVPAALTSLITLKNCKQFFSPQETFVEHTKIKIERKSTTSEAPVKLTKAQFKRPSIRETGKKAKFDVIDDVSILGPQDWPRVCACVVHGAKWQLTQKGWPRDMNTPAKIFARIKGFHFHFDDQKPHHNVDKWQVSKLAISKKKRHLDSKCLTRVWQELDTFLKGKKEFDELLY